MDTEQFHPNLRLGLVWCNSDVTERDWIKYLLRGVATENVAADDIPMPKPGYVYIIDSNTISPNRLAERIHDSIDDNRPVGLIHLADEWFRGNYQSYRLYDFVIRTYHAKRLERAGVLIVPLGWPNKGEGTKPVKLATDRPLNWCFAGNLSSDRFKMVSVFKEWRPNVCRISGKEEGNNPPLARGEYSELLNNTIFCPTPMGNVMAETWRLYEALEAGCIPLAERRLTIDYFFNLLGKNPIPRFKKWCDAKVFAESLALQPRALVALQSEIQNWWEQYKICLTEHVERFVEGGLQGLYRQTLAHWSFPSGAVAKSWQISELIRHHSIEALTWRIDRTIRRNAGAFVGGLRATRRF